VKNVRQQSLAVGWVKKKEPGAKEMQKPGGSGAKKRLAADLKRDEEKYH